MCLSLISCDENDSQSSSEAQSSDASQQGTEDSTQDESESQSESESTSESESESQTVVDENKAYLKIDRFLPSGYDKQSFALYDSEYVLTIELPREWTFTKENEQYTIKRAGKAIGRIISGEPSDVDDWQIVAEKPKSTQDIDIKEIVEKRGSGETLEFRYRWHYLYTENDTQESINVIVTCPETPVLISYKMLSLVTFKRQVTSPQLSTLSDLAGIENAVIIGNSFIGSSQIGYILDDMMSANGKAVDITSVAIGMGNIGKYTSEESLLSSIKSGVYDAVFISGFYTQDDTSSLSIFKDACTQGGAHLVVIPAHNENLYSAIKSATACELPMINWKGEIDELISSGIDKFDLCVNDSYYHSTPLAGYVGAHMIYRAIYGECPSGELSTISQFEISILGDYDKTGTFNVVPPSLIKYLK